MSEGFLTSWHTAELFYRFCGRYKVTKLEDRTAVMREITRRGKAKYLRDVGQFIKGKKVITIQPKGSPRATN